MTELTFTLLRLGFLVLLWVFELSAIGVLRRDLYGTRIAPARRRRSSAPAPRSGHEPIEKTLSARPTATPNVPTKLVVTSGPLQGTTLPLSSAPIIIGRAPSCTLVLDDDYSSSRHAQIFGRDGVWYVEDLGSTNGTFVGDQRVSSVITIGPGSVVRIGQSTVELQR